MHQTSKIVFSLIIPEKKKRKKKEKKEKRERERERGNTDWYIHYSTIRKIKHTWTTSETLLIASSFIRDSKDDTYSAVIKKLTMRNTLIYFDIKGVKDITREVYNSLHCLGR